MNTNLTDLRDFNPGVVLVGLCAVCDRPVRQTDDPTPVYADSDADIPSGFIHGTFDCTDAEGCESVNAGVAYGLEFSRNCQLPEGHTGHCLWGEVG